MPTPSPILRAMDVLDVGILIGVAVIVIVGVNVLIVVVGSELGSLLVVELAGGFRAMRKYSLVGGYGCGGSSISWK